MAENSNLTKLVGVLLVVSVLSLGATLSNISTQGVTGMAVTGTTQATVSSTTTISLPTSSLNFGAMDASESNQTDDNLPAPLTVQNDGSVSVNISVNATNLWTGTGAGNPSAYYRVHANDSSEGQCYISASSQTAYTDMPNSTIQTLLIHGLNKTNSCDLVQVHINVTVPSDEASGAKSSTVEFTASQA